MPQQVELKTSVGLCFVVIVVLIFVTSADEGTVFQILHSPDLLQRFQKDYSLYLFATTRLAFETSGHQCHQGQRHSQIPSLLLEILQQQSLVFPGLYQYHQLTSFDLVLLVQAI